MTQPNYKPWSARLAGAESPTLFSDNFSYQVQPIEGRTPKVLANSIRRKIKAAQIELNQNERVRVSARDGQVNVSGPTHAGIPVWNTVLHAHGVDSVDGIRSAKPDAVAAREAARFRTVRHDGTLQSVAS